MKTRIQAAALAVLSLSWAGCTSLQQPGSLEAFKAAETNTSPVVEAVFEFGGPEGRWAGPTTFAVRVDAREGKRAKVTSTPAVHQGRIRPEATSEGRQPASVNGMEMETARTILLEVSTQMQADGQTSAGCMYPVRARLVRQDGSVVEKFGCRGPQGWPQAVSKAVSDFLGA